MSPWAVRRLRITVRIFIDLKTVKARFPWQHGALMTGVIGHSGIGVMMLSEVNSLRGVGITGLHGSGVWNDLHPETNDVPHTSLL